MKLLKSLFLKLLFLGIILGNTITIMQAQNETKVKIQTQYGDMVVKLYNETPKHRDNFIKLVNEGFYNGTLFHRVIENFMIQGGDPDSKKASPSQMLGGGDIGYTVPAEFVADKFHKKGALAAARMGDNVNPAKASSGCQFYIVQGETLSADKIIGMERMSGTKMTDAQKEIYQTVGGTPFLDGSYTVFGEVVEGMDVIDKIASVQTNPGDRPKEDVSMQITIVK